MLESLLMKEPYKWAMYWNEQESPHILIQRLTADEVKRYGRDVLKTYAHAYQRLEEEGGLLPPGQAQEHFSGANLETEYENMKRASSSKAATYLKGYDNLYAHENAVPDGVISLTEYAAPFGLGQLIVINDIVTKTPGNNMGITLLHAGLKDRRPDAKVIVDVLPQSAGFFEKAGFKTQVPQPPSMHERIIGDTDLTKQQVRYTAAVTGALAAMESRRPLLREAKFTPKLFY